ncbi:MAG: MBL fold metallo-hydrolase [Candidatus Puniceispirillaceae bacterium]
MLRHVSGDLYQIGESVAGHDGIHEAVRVYVLLNDGCPLIFDSGSHIHSGEIMSDLRQLLGDVPAAYVFLTHTELPHTGNLNVILKEWPEAKLVVSSGILPHVELPWWVREDQVSYGYAGTDEVYGGRRISFSDGILKDQPGTHWMFDRKTGTLFSADAFGYLFPKSADEAFDDELEDGIAPDWIKAYHESAFRFLPLAQGHKVADDIAKVFTVRDVRIIAPTHGNAIRGNIPDFTEKVITALKEICQ